MQVEQYILCLDTDQYAGNFERPTTAYATGKLGDCNVGAKEADLFETETNAMVDEGTLDEDVLNEIDDKILQVPDERGCYRPCAIQVTPGWVNDGMGNEYRQSINIPPTEEQIKAYRKSQRDYQLPHLKNSRESTAKKTGNWTPEALEREEEKFRQIENSTPRWFPAYRSVGIFLDEPLSVNALQLVLTRAKKYLTEKGIALEQVRLITQYSDEKSEVLSYCG